LVVHTASLWVVGFTDRFFIAEIEGLKDAGVYTVAYSIALGISAAHDGVSRYFVSRLPQWARNAAGRGRASRFSYGYVVASIASLPLVIPLAYLGLRILVSPSFSEGADLLLWLVPAQTLAGVARVFTGFLYIEGRTHHRAILSTAEAILNVALTWILVVWIGVVGAAVATMLTYAATSVGTNLLARRGQTLMGPVAARLR
jgi:O-antigen/teichoic acid export membrane protein